MSALLNTQLNSLQAFWKRFPAGRGLDGLHGGPQAWGPLRSAWADCWCLLRFVPCVLAPDPLPALKLQFSSGGPGAGVWVAGSPAWWPLACQKEPQAAWSPWTWGRGPPRPLDSTLVRAQCGGHVPCDRHRARCPSARRRPTPWSCGRWG